MRTIFAEGWHEVEHDLRYKNNNCWEQSTGLSRHLNGILATLETCDWALYKVFNYLCYSNYKQSEWVNMLKNKLRIRMLSDIATEELNDVVENNKDDLIKKLYMFDRNKLLQAFAQTRIPISLDNVIYLTNYLFIFNIHINEITPSVIKEKLDKIKNSILKK